MRDPKQYEKIIVGMAYKFAPTLKEEIEDLIQDGYVLYQELVIKESTKGLSCPFEAALSTLIKQTFITNHYHKSKAAKRTGIMVSFEETKESFDAMNPILKYNPEKELVVWCSLTEEVKELVLLMKNTPTDLAILLREFDFKKGISIYLKDFKRWDKKKILKMWSEIGQLSVV